MRRVPTLDDIDLGAFSRLKLRRRLRGELFTLLDDAEEENTYKHFRMKLGRAWFNVYVEYITLDRKKMSLDVHSENLRYVDGVKWSRRGNGSLRQYQSQSAALVDVVAPIVKEWNERVAARTIQRTWRKAFSKPPNKSLLHRAVVLRRGSYDRQANEERTRELELKPLYRTYTESGKGVVRRTEKSLRASSSGGRSVRKRRSPTPTRSPSPAASAKRKRPPLLKLWGTYPIGSWTKKKKRGSS